MDDIFTGYNWSGLTVSWAKHLISSEYNSYIRDRSSTEFYQFGAKFIGETNVIYNGRQYSYSAGTVIYIPKENNEDIQYERTILKPSEGVCIFFNSPYLLPPNPAILQCANQPPVKELFMKMVNIYTQNNELAYMAVFYRLLERMRYVVINSPEKQTLKNRLAPAVEYINEHFCDNYIDIFFLAAMCGMTSEYFRHQFKLAFHISPLKYINHQKINHAKKLLSEDKTVGDTALLLGFSNANYFSRFFKEYTGLSPSKYQVFYRDKF